MTHYPILCVRDPSVFPLPEAVVELAVGRPLSVWAIEAAWSGDRQIVVACQHDPDVESPTLAEVHGIGVLCEVVEHATFPGGVSVTLTGQRCVALRALEEETALVEPAVDTGRFLLAGPARAVRNAYERFVELHAPFVAVAASQVRDAPVDALPYNVANHFWLADLRPQLVAIRSLRQRLKWTTAQLEALAESCASDCQHDHPMRAIVGDEPVNLGPTIRPGGNTRMPLLPLREAVEFPEDESVRLFVGRPSSIAALRAAGEAGCVFVTVRRVPPSTPVWTSWTHSVS